MSTLGLEPDRQARERQRPQRLGAPEGDADAEHRAEHAQDEALRQQQPGDAHRAGAEREAHAHLPLTRARAGQHEVGGVAADGEQQQQHDRLKDDQGRGQHALRPARRLPEGEHLAAHRAVGLRVGLGELPHGRVELALRLRARHRRLELAHDRIAADVAVFELARSGHQDRRERGRHPHFEVQPEHRPLKPARRHADNRQIAAVERAWSGRSPTGRR